MRKFHKIPQNSISNSLTYLCPNHRYNYLCASLFSFDDFLFLDVKRKRIENSLWSLQCPRHYKICVQKMNKRLCWHVLFFLHFTQKEMRNVLWSLMIWDFCGKMTWFVGQSKIYLVLIYLIIVVQLLCWSNQIKPRFSLHFFAPFFYTKRYCPEWKTKKGFQTRALFDSIYLVIVLFRPSKQNFGFI